MIFISHAWVNGKPDENVLWLVAKLRECGFGAKCDVMFTGDRTAIHFKQMMAENMQKADKIIVILSEIYKKKADLFEGGVGVEYKYILEDIDVNTGKYILVSFNNNLSEAEIPDFLRGREIIYLKKSFEKLIYRLEDIPEYIFPEVNPEKIAIKPNIISTIENFNDTLFNRKENLPFIRNKFFSSREDILKSIHVNFRTYEDRQIIQILSGIGGVGKTQIAIEFAYSFLDYYPLIWWIKAETKQGIVDSFMELGRNLGISDSHLNLDESEKVAIIIEKLNCVKRYLLIFDNANCLEEIEKYLPKSNVGSILITSRDNNWKMIGNVISVDVFTPQEALDFIRKRTLINDMPGAEVLSKRLGFLPLAIEQAAAYIVNNALSFFDYIKLFEKYKLKLFDLESSKPLNYANTVTITSRLSINRINNESSAQLLKIISFLDADSIELVFFTNSEKILPHPLSECIQNELRLKEIIWELKRYSLIKEENKRLSIHRLLQEVIREEDGMKNYYEYAFNIIINNIFIDENLLCIRVTKYDEFKIFYPYILSLCKNMDEYYGKCSIFWYKHLAMWFMCLFRSDSPEGSIIISFVKGFFEIIVLVCKTINDLDYFIYNFIWLINENNSGSKYLNAAGNIFLPLLKHLDYFPDDIGCAFYIVLCVVGGRNGWRERNKDRDLKYLERAKKIYNIYGRKEAIEYINNYDMLMVSYYKWDEKFHNKLLR